MSTCNTYNRIDFLNIIVQIPYLDAPITHRSHKYIEKIRVW